LYLKYYADGNLLSSRPDCDEEEKSLIEIEYPDGSKFMGTFSTETEHQLMLGQG
jgi:hypothetical protein